MRGVRTSGLPLLALLLLVGACHTRKVGDMSGETENAAGPDADDAQESKDVPETGDGCRAATAEALSACVERDRYFDDLSFIADIRVPGDTHWQAVQDLCFDRLAELGYEVEAQEYGTGTNVVGRKPGQRRSGEDVIIAAHYDHIPGCMGADDNASGVAGVLEAARVLAQGEYERTLVVACWDQEEIGLLGSNAYAQAAAAADHTIVVNFNLEMIGFTSDAPNSQTVPTGFNLLFPAAYQQVQDNAFRGDFIALVANARANDPVQRLAAHADRLELPQGVLELPTDLANSPVVADLRRSDHAAFWAVGYPAVMLTDTSNFRNANYHCVGGEDSVESLDHDFSAKVVAATVAAAAETLELVRL